MFILLIGCGAGPGASEKGTTEPVHEDETPEVPWDGQGEGEDEDADREDAFLYGAETNDFALTLSDAAIAALADDADDDVPDVPGTFAWGDETYEVGVRLRGGNGSFQPFEQKPGFAIDFGEQVEGQTFHGVRHLTLKNMVQDESMLGEHAGLALATVRGVPAPRHGFARVHVNGEWFGLYGVIEAVDTEDFVARALGADGGPLWEGKMDDLEAGAVEGYDVALDGDLPDPYAPLHALVAVLDASTPDTFLDTLATHTALDTVLEMMAVELVSGNPDGYVTWTNNYYLHQDPGTGRIQMVAWGPDQAFTEEIPVYEDHPGRLYADCRASPACDAELRRRVGEVAGVLASDAWLDWLRAEADRTEADCMGDPRSPGGAAECADGREDLWAFMATRPGQVESQLTR